ncbi:MAG TPA: ribonucleoside-triphosphate reductase, adenosylcobalamin-dependent [Methylomicrobium sp.]|nr:ribonucleoside-triphosphate reductase, adenosylcobalamin-dependent [Methylomicrobium sp.]
MEMTPTGESVYKRTYSRQGETWPETVRRVVDGNIALCPTVEPGEREELIEMIESGKIVPAGRHLAMSGVPDADFLFNCHVSGWTKDLSQHFMFTFLRLMEGGGVGANYSHYLLSGNKYNVHNLVHVRFTCSKNHRDYESLAGSVTEPFANGDVIKVHDSREGWASALGAIITAATSLAYHEVDDETGVGHTYLTFDVSDVRPKGAPIKTFGGTAAGPLPLVTLLSRAATVMADMWECGVSGPSCMELDHAIAECVISGNVRRSARMSIMRWDDPFIAWFLSCKKDMTHHWSTNISVEIDKRFIEYVDPECSPESEGDIADRNLAREVYRLMCEGMLANGEPGFWNSHLSNKDEPNRVNATNPCGEIPLEDWEACCLGQVNLAAWAGKKDCIYEILRAHILMTRYLIRATYGSVRDQHQRDVMDRNRRIGVGHMGVQWFLAGEGIRYSDAHRSTLFRWLLDTAEDISLIAAEEYSKELGIPTPVKVTAIAPTGSIGKLFGVSEGIHPIYSKYFIRRIRFSSIDPDQVKQVDEYRRLGYDVEDDIYSKDTLVVSIPTKDPILCQGFDESIIESADEIDIKDMLAFQAMYQEKFANNAVSFTINIPGGSTTPEELADSLRPYLGRLKGTTIMPDGTRAMAPYERVTKQTYEVEAGYLAEVAAADSYGDGSCASGACPVR